MKKLIVCALIACGMAPASAQEYGLFNNIGANLGVGTEGISVGVATPITEYLELSAAINTAADRGCTVMDGHGCYSGKDVHMLFVLARQRESQTIFRLIDEIDPSAFVSQSAVIGVYGLGFDRFKVNKKLIGK